MRRGYANSSQCTLLHPVAPCSLNFLIFLLSARLHGNSGLLLLAILVHLHGYLRRYEPVPWCVSVCVCVSMIGEL